MVAPELGNGRWFTAAIIAQMIEKVKFCKAYCKEKQNKRDGLPESSLSFSLIGSGISLNDLESALTSIQERLVVKHWQPRRINDAAYEVDDVLDNFEAQIESDTWLSDMKSGIPSSIGSSFQRPSSHADFAILKQVRHLKTPSLKPVKDVFLSKVKKLENKSLDADPIGIQKIVVKLRRIRDELFDSFSWRPLSFYVEEITDSEQAFYMEELRDSETCSLLNDIVFGRDREKKTILGMLLASEKPESSEIVNASDKEPSLRVLPIVGIGGVGKTTLAQLIFNDEGVAKHFNLRHWIYVHSRINATEILRQLQRTAGADFEDRKFLIVLDHVCNSYHWEELHRSLSCGAKGSMVLVTTQSKMIAKKMGSMDPIVLDVLRDDDLWNLFKHCAFHDTNLDKERMETLQQIGRKIVAKLHGLPLLAKAIGSLLRIHLSEDYWNDTLRSHWWELDPVLNDIVPSLGSSFQHLKSNLKLCVAYCSIFPKGYIFKKDKLIQMWIAQGFIQPNPMEEQRIEDIGGQYFDELTNQFFFRSAQSNIGFIMDDLMHELAVFVSLDECCAVNADLENIPFTIRHLTINKDVIKDLHRCTNLRTLLCFGHHSSSSWCSALRSMSEHLKGLRVLDLSHSSRVAAMFLDVIGDLSHLRYLDLSDTGNTRLPRTIRRLCHLQVLNLENCSNVVLPANMNEMISIRHLYAEVDAISSIVGIGKLTNLQELNKFHVERKAGHRISELGNLKELHGRLHLLNLENIESKEEAMMAELKGKKHLRGLQLQGVQFTQEILEGLQPHTNLKELEINGYAGSGPPVWMTDDLILTSLEELKFQSCSRLEHLPACLKFLTSLRKLEIIDCKEISSLPEDGLPTSLKRLCIVSSPFLRKTCQKEPQGLDWPKIAHIPFISIDEKIIQML